MNHPPDACPSAPGAALREIDCRSILSPSGIPGADYSINPYVGCLHACAYCYAHYMQRWSGHEEPWGTFVDVKVNAVRVLIRGLRRTPPSRIFMSSVTDPYQPPERRYLLTRRILEALAPLPHSIGIHTKSALVTRDLDILRSCRDVSVTFTIVTGDPSAARRLEPGAPPVAARIRALEALARAGIETAVFIAPVIPFVTERGIGELIRDLAGAGVRRVTLDDLHYLPRLAGRLVPALRACDPSLPARVFRAGKDCYQQTARIVLECCHGHEIRCDVFFQSPADTRPLNGGARCVVSRHSRRRCAPRGCFPDADGR